VNLQYLKPFHNNPPRFAGWDLAKPLRPVVIDTEGEFEVETIMNETVHRSTKKKQYLVKWKGYEDHDATWELEKTIQDVVALDTYLDTTTKEKEPQTAQLLKQRQWKQGVQQETQVSRKPCQN
jgi:hypothetical protein